MFTTTMLALMLASAPAQGTGQQRIAVCNLTQIFDNFSMTRDLEQMFDARNKEFQARAEEKRQELESKRNQLAQFKPGSDDYMQREQEFIEEQYKFQGWLELWERRLKKEHKLWLRQVYQNVQDATAELSTEQSISLVLTYSNIDEDAPDSAAMKQQILLRTVLFADARIDLTQPILTRLEERYERAGGAASLQKSPPKRGPK